jgi:hypothetical protein
MSLKLTEREKHVWDTYSIFTDVKPESLASATSESVEFVRKTLSKANRQLGWKGKGLIGIYGLTFIERNDGDCRRVLQYQFRIVGRDDDGDYVVQYFSAMDGSPSCLGRISKADLFDQYKTELYPDPMIWHEKYQEANRRDLD